jgi:hypothetical protein
MWSVRLHSMNTKQLVIFGTRHYTEKRIPPEIRVAMDLIVDNISPTIGLEEWSINQVERSGFDVVCEAKKILVIGIAHLQSMCVKLKNNFQIRAYAFGPELL